MDKSYNSSVLAKQVAEKLKLNKAEEMELYNELSQTGSRRIRNVLDMLTRPNGNVANKYAACIKASYVRDVRYMKSADMEPVDESSWTYVDRKPVFLDIVEAETPTRAKQIAAIHGHVDQNVIELYPIL